MPRQHRRTLKVSEHSTVVEKCAELIDNALAQLFSPTGRMLCAINQIALPQVLLVPVGIPTATSISRKPCSLISQTASIGVLAATTEDLDVFMVRASRSSCWISSSTSSMGVRIATLD